MTSTSLIEVMICFTDYLCSSVFICGSKDQVAQHRKQILPVRILPHRLGELLKLLRVDVSHAERDLLGARDLEALAPLDRLDEVRRLEERFVGSRVEPRGPASHHLD